MHVSNPAATATRLQYTAHLPIATPTPKYPEVSLVVWTITHRASHLLSLHKRHAEGQRSAAVAASPAPTCQSPEWSRDHGAVQQSTAITATRVMQKDVTQLLWPPHPPVSHPSGVVATGWSNGIKLVKEQHAGRSSCCARKELPHCCFALADVLVQQLWTLQD